MKQFFEKFNIEDKVVVAAVSGGADSLALALRLKESGKKVVALTVDHGLRPESAAEALYVSQVMSANGIEHHILEWTGHKPEKGIEEAARQARYRLMFDFCKANRIGVLATGHHLRDQAETFLLRLQRGSGVFGLSGILPVSERNGIILIRPQLSDSPEALRQYLSTKHIKWVEDPMNQDEDFARVKIRHFLPELERIGIDAQCLADTAATLLKTRLFLSETADKFIESRVRFFDKVAACLSWQRLKALPQEIAMIVLGQLIKKIGAGEYSPESAEILRVLEKADDFKGCTLGKCELFIASKRLWIVPQDEDSILMSRQEWENFCKTHQEYLSAGLPYKVRRALRNKTEKQYGEG